MNIGSAQPKKKKNKNKRKNNGSLDKIEEGSKRVKFNLANNQSRGKSLDLFINYFRVLYAWKSGHPEAAPKWRKDHPRQRSHKEGCKEYHQKEQDRLLCAVIPR